MPNTRPLPLPVIPLMTAGWALMASACADTNIASDPPVAQPLAEAPVGKAKTRAAAQRTAAEASGAKETQQPIAEARSLRHAGDKAGAQRVLEKAAAEHPTDSALLRERGLLALDMGQVGKAEGLLKKAIDPRTPDWRVHLGLGTALAASGKQQQAQLQLAKALELAPDHPAILNNLALSYALDGKLAEAEKLLRRVAVTEGQPSQAGQAKQNLALLLGLSGRIEEAQKISTATLPAEQARANVEYLKSAAAEQTPNASAQASRPVAAARNLPEPTYRLGGAQQ
jgi:Flp pilus assembly protein TadD